MNEMQALEALGPLVAMCGAWDDGNVMAWKELLLDLEHVAAATEATKVTVQTWKKPQRPPFGIWLDSYKSAVVRGFLNEERALSAPKGTEITLYEYLDLCLERNDLTELGVWEHHASKWRITDKDVRIAGQQAQPWAGEMARWFNEHPDWAQGATAAHQGEQTKIPFRRPSRPIGEYLRDPEEER